MKNKNNSPFRARSYLLSWVQNQHWTSAYVGTVHGLALRTPQLLSHQLSDKEGIHWLFSWTDFSLPIL